MKILVFDVGGTAIKSAVINEKNELSDQRTTLSSAASGNVRVEKILEIASTYRDYDAISVATTGQVDEKTRSILFRYNADKDSEADAYPMGELIEAALGKPVFILNDCNAAALGEAYFGAGRGRENFLCLTYGTGVGGAIIEGGKLYTGARGIAAEVGHMVTHKGGVLCRCGRRGCYEEYASTTALVRNAKRYFPDVESAKEIFEKHADTREMKRVIGAWEDEILAGLLTLTYIFNPACFILGGGIMEQESVLSGVRQKFYKNVIPTFKNVEILQASLGNRAGMYGAAVYARQNLKI